MFLRRLFFISALHGQIMFKYVHVLVIYYVPYVVLIILVSDNDLCVR